MQKTRCDTLSKIKSTLESDKLVALAYIGGSFARNTSDRLSDIDICIMWAEIPSYENRLALFKKWNAEIIKLDRTSVNDISGVADSMLIDGYKFDFNSLHYTEILWMVQNFDNIKKLTTSLCELFYALKTANAIKGSALLAQMNSKISIPNSSQIDDVLNRYLEYKSKLESLEKALHRKDNLQINKIKIEIYERLYFTLCLASKNFYPGQKRSADYIVKYKLDSILPGMSQFWNMSEQCQYDFLKSSFNKNLLACEVKKHA